MRSYKTRLAKIESKLMQNGIKDKYPYGAIILPANLNPDDWLAMEPEDREPQPTYEGFYNYGAIILPETMEPDDWQRMANAEQVRMTFS